MLWLAGILIVNVFLYPVNCEVTDNVVEKSVSSSVFGMKDLLAKERQLLAILDNFAKELEDKAAFTRRATAVMRAENLKSLDNEEEYLSNPLHSFALIRRMHEDWVHWELFMSSLAGGDEIKAVNKLNLDMPTNTDMEEATEGMFRIQTTYDLEAKDIANGLLNGIQYNSSLSSHDCYEIGRRLVDKEDNLYAIHWLHTSWQRYEYNEINAALEFDILDVIDLYVETLLKEKMYSFALSAIDVALQISPNNTKFLNEKSKIEQEMLTKAEPTPRPLIKDQWPYYRCCRGEFDHRLSRLQCRYNTTNHPYLKLAPFKMEELKLDPYIVIFHDVISDTEIAEVKKQAITYLERDRVFLHPTKSEAIDKSRTSKAHSFHDNASDLTLRIIQRIGDMSGFDMMCAESMHLINYGLGGHYIPHYDAFNGSEGSELSEIQGDRIATVMFYLSDVEQGGATVFPNVETTVHARKGMALLWYNLNNRGERDENTLHGACPVIVGSKWVMTRWIREREQLFRRPCY